MEDKARGGSCRPRRGPADRDPSSTQNKLGSRIAGEAVTVLGTTATLERAQRSRLSHSGAIRVVHGLNSEISWVMGVGAPRHMTGNCGIREKREEEISRTHSQKAHHPIDGRFGPIRKCRSGWVRILSREEVLLGSRFPCNLVSTGKLMDDMQCNRVL